MKTRITFWVDGEISDDQRDEINSAMPVECEWHGMMQPLSDEQAEHEKKVARDAFPFKATVMVHAANAWHVNIGHSPNDFYGDEEQ